MVISLLYRKDVRLPVQLQRAMAAEAEAAREARAKVTFPLRFLLGMTSTVPTHPCTWPVYDPRNPKERKTVCSVTTSPCSFFLPFLKTTTGAAPSRGASGRHLFLMEAATMVAILAAMLVVKMSTCVQSCFVKRDGRGEEHKCSTIFWATDATSPAAHSSKCWQILEVF